MTLGLRTRSILAPVVLTGLVATSAATAASTATTPTASAAAPVSAEKRTPHPHRIPLPAGYQPEGIATAGGARAWFGSLADGDVYVANLRTGKGHRIHQGDGTPSVGMKIDARKRLWIAGGADGDAKVLNARTGRTVAHFDFTSDASFVNDVVLRRNAAWFTDSQNAVLYKVAPRRGKAASATVTKVPLKGAWSQVANDFNANGISTTPGGRALLVVQSATGTLFKVDPRTGRATKVGLRGYRLTNGDGMLRVGRTLYVAQNRDNVVAKIRLNKAGTKGRLVRTIRSAEFDVPTTIASWKGGLYLPNARFTTTPTPTTSYWATRVRK